MGIQNYLLLLYPSNYVDVPVRYHYSLRIVRKVVEIVKLLNLVRLVFEVKEVAVGLFDGEYRNLFDSA